MAEPSTISQAVEQFKAGLETYKEGKVAQSALRAVGLKTLAKNLSWAQLQSLYQTSRMPDPNHRVYDNSPFKYRDGTSPAIDSTPKEARARYYNQIFRWKEFASRSITPTYQEYTNWVNVGNSMMRHTRACFHPGSLDLFADLAEWTIEHLPNCGDKQRGDFREEMLAAWLKAREIGIKWGMGEVGGDSRLESWKKEIEREREEEGE